MRLAPPPPSSYNALDAVTEAKDFKGVATTYARDAQGNATTEASTDTGARQHPVRQPGARPRSILDALGQATTITRDAAGQPDSLWSSPTARPPRLRYDLRPAARGICRRSSTAAAPPSSPAIPSAVVTLKKQTLVSGRVQQVSYGYSPNGALMRVVYPTRRRR